MEVQRMPNWRKNYKKMKATLAAVEGLQATMEPTIPGLIFIPDFITQEEESMLLDNINKMEWSDDLKRRTQQYGWKFSHQNQNLSEYLGPMPPFFDFILDRLVEKGCFPNRPDQMILNEYLPGQGINPHIDKTHCFAEHVGGLSLGSSTVMSFRLNHPTPDLPLEQMRQDVFLPRRSLLVLTGPSRYLWQHGIEPRTQDNFKGSVQRRKLRVSITFRNVILDKKMNGKAV